MKWQHDHSTMKHCPNADRTWWAHDCLNTKWIQNVCGRDGKGKLEWIFCVHSIKIIAAHWSQTKRFPSANLCCSDLLTSLMQLQKIANLYKCNHLDKIWGLHCVELNWMCLVLEDVSVPDEVIVHQITLTITVLKIFAVTHSVFHRYLYSLNFIFL